MGNPAQQDLVGGMEEGVKRHGIGVAQGIRQVDSFNPTPARDRQGQAARCTAWPDARFRSLQPKLTWLKEPNKERS